jgi:uncharacterized protein
VERKTKMGKEMKTITKRLLPGSDLKDEIEKMVAENNIKAGTLLSIVGSLTRATLRLADEKIVKSWDGVYEIVSGTGTVSTNGCHLHVSVSDEKGTTIGGHLKQGCIIRTTAEIVLLSLEDVEYNRLPDDTTGFDELVVK